MPGVAGVPAHRQKAALFDHSGKQMLADASVLVGHLKQSGTIHQRQGDDDVGGVTVEISPTEANGDVRIFP